MVKSKWNISFHNSLGVKVVRADLRNAVLSGQQKQQNVLLERIIKVVAVVYGLCNVAFSNTVYKRMDFVIYLGIDESFS